MFNRFFVICTLSIAVLALANAAQGQDVPPCFMQSSDGTIVDLGELCENEAPMPQPSLPPQLDPDRGGDGGRPSPRTVLDPSVTLVPGQTQKPPIEIYDRPSSLWNRVPDSPQPIQESSIQ